MKKYLAVFIGSETSVNAANWNTMDEKTRKEREAQGGAAWMKWAMDHQKSIVEMGAPLGETKQVNRGGISDITNSMSAFTIVQAESQDAAAKLFINHPHFTIFPGDSVEIMECLPIPKF